CSHNNYCGISIYSDNHRLANFIQSSETKNFTITKAGAGSGRVISDPGGIDCGDDCSENYLINTYVSLRAIPEPGSVFSGWLGNDDCDDGNVLMNEDRTCIALFSTQTDYWLKTFGTMDNNEASSILSLPDGSMVIAG
ncbi:MAG: hypothetical protein N2257_03910, partial [Thermodesulfovibrionales bacterium]|nr:hypothetical protein [Thermodesulfovibrionales bacterium]